MVKIACPECNAKKYIRFGQENTDAPGASPRHYGAPVAIVLYYLNRLLSNTEESHAPYEYDGHVYPQGQSVLCCGFSAQCFHLS